MFVYISLTTCMQPVLAQAVLVTVEHALARIDPGTDLDLLTYNQAATLLGQTVGLFTLVHR
jgi:hypothetical protein